MIRAFLCLFLALAGPLHAFDDLNDRAKWKSFGLKPGLDFDPFEIARPGRNPVKPSEFGKLGGNTPAARLKSLIALAEAGPRGYDAYHVGARVPPPKKPTQMTLAEIQRWIKNTPGQPHAIGRYQIIPSTLKALISRSNISRSARFSPKVQDQLADILLADAKLQAFEKGQISRTTFMKNLARIWAGFPLPNGKSYYDGYAGNRATISYASYKAEIKRIYPDR